MSYIRRDMRFKDFGQGNFIAALIIGVVLTGLLVWGLGTFRFGSLRSDEVAEQNIYLSLREERVDDEEAVKTARLIKIIYAADGRDGLKNISEIADKNSYVAKAAKHLDNLELILRGDPEAENIKVVVSLWSSWFWIASILSWLIMVTALSIGYLIIDAEGKWWQYPWNKLWAYPMALTMPVYIVFVQPGTGIYFLINQIGGEHAREKREKKESQKINFDRSISLAQSRLESSRRAWNDLRVNGLKEDKKSLERELKERHASLVGLGQKIEASQRNLAETQTKLGEIREIIKTVPAKTEEEINREFDELLRQPGLKAVEVSSREIKLYTETIFIDYRGKTYELGDYLIKIILWPMQYITIENLRNTSTRGSHHPFSYNYRWTNFCFGTNADRVAQSLKEKNFYPLIVFILQAIRNGNTERVRDWRVVKEGEK